MKITDKILSIPPYISTSWSKVAALHMKGSMLTVTLMGGDSLNVPHLPADVLQLIFQCHAAYLEKESPPARASSSGSPSGLDDASIRLAFGSSLEGLGQMMQHNPAQADAPDLPPEMIEKISAIARIVGSGDAVVVPQPEPGCNCFHCQIARAFSPPAPAAAEEPEVLASELQFQQWAITQTGDKLFAVVNRLDEREKYSVYLGHPVGCTCGQQGCEHILAVLKS